MDLHMDLMKLAATLREHGANIFNGRSKFTLTTNILNGLIESFGLLFEQQDPSIHVKHSMEMSELLCTLQFLHDFIKKTTSLKIIASPELKSTKIDLSHFKNLKLLEISKINFGSFVDDSLLKEQLLTLYCSRSTNTMGEILDFSKEDQRWENLKELSLIHSNVQVLECLHLIPNLHTLDLCHNVIENADALNMLVNLKHLNLAYNRLHFIPHFTGQLSTRLQVLVLSNNFIEELSPVANLVNLRELDLSENCILEHNLLVPISNAANLQILKLEGNPLYYHPQHRMKTAQCLHENIRTFKFVLDRQVLSKSENQVVGTLHPRLRIRIDEEKLTQPSVPIEKFRRVRNVTISDTEFTPPMTSSMPSNSSLLQSFDHLDTKRQIEQLKKEYGDKWLHHQSGSLVQNVLGMDKEPNIVASTPYDQWGPSANLLIQAELKPDINRSEQTLEEYETAVEETPEHTQSATNDSAEIYQEVIDDSESTHSEDANLGDGEENIFLISVIGKDDPIFFVITDDYLMERESCSTKEITRWPVESLVSCENDEETLTLHFDTLKSDCKVRDYAWDVKESPNLLKTLKEIIENKREMKISKVFKCLKCSTQFQVEKSALTYEAPQKCRSCESELVFEE